MCLEKKKKRMKDLAGLFSLVVEHLPRKQKVEGSIPLIGFFIMTFYGICEILTKECDCIELFKKCSN